MLSALSKGHLGRSPWPCLKLPLDGARISNWIILGRTLGAISRPFWSVCTLCMQTGLPYLFLTLYSVSVSYEKWAE